MSSSGHHRDLHLAGDTHQLEEFVRSFNQAFVSYRHVLADLCFLDVLQQRVVDHRLLQLRQDLLCSVAICHYLFDVLLNSIKPVCSTALDEFVDHALWDTTPHVQKGRAGRKAMQTQQIESKSSGLNAALQI